MAVPFMFLVLVMLILGCTGFYLQDASHINASGESDTPIRVLIPDLSDTIDVSLILEAEPDDITIITYTFKDGKPIYNTTYNETLKTNIEMDFHKEYISLHVEGSARKGEYKIVVTLKSTPNDPLVFYVNVSALLPETQTASEAPAITTVGQTTISNARYINVSGESDRRLMIPDLSDACEVSLSLKAEPDKIDIIITYTLEDGHPIDNTTYKETLKKNIKMDFHNGYISLHVEGSARKGVYTIAVAFKSTPNDPQLFYVNVNAQLPETPTPSEAPLITVGDTTTINMVTVTPKSNSSTVDYMVILLVAAVTTTTVVVVAVLVLILAWLYFRKRPHAHESKQQDDLNCNRENAGNMDTGENNSDNEEEAML